MSIRLVIAATLLIGLAGCGQREVLKPTEGHALPPKPATAPAQPDVATLLTPPTESRPTRIDNILRKSEERPDDRFKLPPSG